VNHPSPAIVAQGAVRRLPRLALLLLCAAYVIPGLVGREPWRSADMATFGYMLDMAQGMTSWLDPQMLGMRPTADGLLPYWIGALAVQWGPAWISPVLLVRIPFALMLILTLVATWYAVYGLAQNPRAQPVAFAFGGEANPVDYARAIGDGGLLAMIACLGLAQLSHEVTTHLAQLCFAALTFYGVTTIGYRMLAPLAALTIGMTGLVLSAAPSLAMLFGAGAALLHLLAADPATGGRRKALRAAGILALITLLAAALASALDLWHWRILLPQDASGKDWRSLARLFLWFTWPAWPLVLLTLWRWRRQLLSTRISLHLTLPLWFAAIAIFSALTTKPADRALLLALPPLAALAAFALPTLQRSVSALIDWFTLLFFTGCGIVIWVIWIAMQTGVPRQAAINVFKQAPDFHADFSLPVFLIALLASMVWGWLVKWRVGRHQAAIWKSLVLPAGGATLCWLLLMTLWMPLLDFVRSNTVVAAKVASLIRPQQCLQASHNIERDQVAALRYHGDIQVEAARPASSCPWLIADADLQAASGDVPDPTLWEPQAAIRRSSGKGDDMLLYRRIKPQP
jgi:4-amino-4-deoxy-L-arabinose transferase-like glycosyltransferase